MTIPKNDPKLWTEEGIGDALDEATGEMGIAVEWGWVCLGTVYRRASRAQDPMMPLPQVRDRPDRLELHGTVSVSEHEVRDFLIADAEAHLGPGVRYELRKKQPTSYGRAHGMCWYRNIAMDKRKKWGRVLLQSTLAEGYFLVGEYTTPKRPTES